MGLAGGPAPGAEDSHLSSSAPDGAEPFGGGVVWTAVINADGLPEWTPPRRVDAHQRPQINTGCATVRDMTTVVSRDIRERTADVLRQVADAGLRAELPPVARV